MGFVSLGVPTGLLLQRPNHCAQGEVMLVEQLPKPFEHRNPILDREHTLGTWVALRSRRS